MVSRPATRTLIEAALRVIAVLIASLVIVVALFDGTVQYALTVGLLVGIGYAVAARFLRSA